MVCVCPLPEMWSSQSLFLSVSAPVVTADSTTATTISLSWTSGGSEGVSYEVDWQRVTTGECDDEDEDSATLVGGSMTSYTVTELKKGSNYTITVTASNDNGKDKDSSIMATTQTEGAIYSSVKMKIATDIRSSICPSLFCESVSGELHCHHCPVGTSGTL